VTGLWIGTVWPPTQVETIATLWQRTRAAVARRAKVPIFVPVLVVAVVLICVGIGLLLGTPRFVA
jgi:hypothetical protein